MKKLLLNWSFMRVIRMSLALLILAQSIIQGDWTLGVIAGILLLTALLNVGCCGPAGCTVPPKKTGYETLDNK
jgi:hypothetical protein